MPPCNEHTALEGSMIGWCDDSTLYLVALLCDVRGVCWFLQILPCEEARMNSTARCEVCMFRSASVTIPMSGSHVCVDCACTFWVQVVTRGALYAAFNRAMWEANVEEIKRHAAV